MLEKYIGAFLLNTGFFMIVLGFFIGLINYNSRDGTNNRIIYNSIILTPLILVLVYTLSYLFYPEMTLQKKTWIPDIPKNQEYLVCFYLLLDWARNSILGISFIYLSAVFFIFLRTHRQAKGYEHPHINMGKRSSLYNSFSVLRKIQLSN
jgi:hypothetical protein